MNRVLLMSVTFVLAACSRNYSTNFVGDDLPTGKPIAYTQLELDPSEPARNDDETYPTNVTVLPKNWTDERVMEYMVTITKGLGVKCGHCHTGGDQSLDTLPAKVAARNMLRMTLAMDKTFGGGNGVFTCATCHKGNATPDSPSI